MFGFAVRSDRPWSRRCPCSGSERLPEEGDDADHVRTGHRGAAEVRIRGVARSVGRARARAGGDDVGLDAVGAVERDRTAAAEADELDSCRGERARREGGVVDAGGSVTVLQPGPALPAEASTKMPAAWVFSTIVCRVSARSPRSAGSPSCCSSRAAGAPDRVAARSGRRRQEELEALDVGRRRAVPLVHVPAADPLRARRHADLVGPVAVVAEVVPVVCVPWECRRRAPACSGRRSRRPSGSRPASCSRGSAFAPFQPR